MGSSKLAAATATLIVFGGGALLGLSRHSSAQGNPMLDGCATLQCAIEHEWDHRLAPNMHTLALCPMEGTPCKLAIWNSVGGPGHVEVCMYVSAKLERGRLLEHDYGFTQIGDCSDINQ